MAFKIYEEEKIRAIAEKIRDKTGKSTHYTTSEMPFGIEQVFLSGYEKGDTDRMEQMMGDVQNAYDGGYSVGYDEGYSQGKKRKESEFWDSYQQNGERTDYNCAFSGVGWNNENFNPKHELLNIKSAANMFLYSGVKSILKDLDFTKSTSMTNAFADSSIEYIHSIKIGSKCALTNTFSGADKLYYMSVQSPILLNIDLKDCPLCKDSIYSVVTMLNQSSSGKFLKLKKSAVDAAFETEIGANDGSDSEEWLALKNTRTSWNIELI